MNVMQNSNLFPDKGAVSDHYSPYMILSQRNWDHNKHCQVEFGAYVKASQVNSPKNNNRPRTLDGIYLCPAPNLYGGHHIMDLWTGNLITIPKVVEILITYVVINSVEKWLRIKDLSH